MNLWWKIKAEHKRELSSLLETIPLRQNSGWGWYQGIRGGNKEKKQKGKNEPHESKKEGRTTVREEREMGDTQDYWKRQRREGGAFTREYQWQPRRSIRKNKCFNWRKWKWTKRHCVCVCVYITMKTFYWHRAILWRNIVDICMLACTCFMSCQCTMWLCDGSGSWRA